MINTIWLHSALPLLSALCCLLLLKKLMAKQSSRDCVLIFANIVLINLVQAFGQVMFSVSPQLAEYIADAYLITVYFFFAHLVLFVKGLSNRETGNQYRYSIYAVPVLLTGFHFCGLMVESYRFEQNSLMHNDGPLAWCLDLYLLMSCCATITILVKNVRQCDNSRITTSKNIIALISFIPFILVFGALVLLSMTEYAIPVVVIVPLVTTYTALTFYYLSRDKVADLSIGWSFFYDRLQLAHQLLETHKTKTDLKAFHKAIERQFIKEALQEKSGNIMETAKYLAVDHTTLRYKMKKYGLSNGGT